MSTAQAADQHPLEQSREHVLSLPSWAKLTIRLCKLLDICVSPVDPMLLAEPICLLLASAGYCGYAEPSVFELRDLNLEQPQYCSSQNALSSAVKRSTVSREHTLTAQPVPA